MQMEWCLGCHRDPEPNLRPRAEIFDMAWTPPADGGELQRRLMKEYDVQRKTDCSVCHR